MYKFTNSTTFQQQKQATIYNQLSEHSAICTAKPATVPEEHNYIPLAITTHKQRIFIYGWVMMQISELHSMIKNLVSD
jgi:hypothetical protein